jgi:hypothetical protein
MVSMRLPGNRFMRLPRNRFMRLPRNGFMRLLRNGFMRLPRNGFMRLPGLLLIGLGLLAATPARSQAVRLEYDIYAAGMDVAAVDASVAIGPLAYRLNLSWRTRGVANLLFGGHQTDWAEGVWRGTKAQPREFNSDGLWHGEPHRVQIGYDLGQPVVRSVIPSLDREREAVPPHLRANTIDILSAMAELIKVVAQSGQCEDTVRTFDGRRANAVTAHTAGREILPPSGRTSFAGPALRCDFEGRMLAGFRLDGNRQADGRPIHGTAWLAKVAPDQPDMPVRLRFETRWFGWATMYLNRVTVLREPVVASH